MAPAWTVTFSVRFGLPGGVALESEPPQSTEESTLVIRKALSGQHPLQIFGTGEQTRTLTHIDDIADGVVTAMGSPAALHEDFNISAAEELTVAEIARIVWAACGRDPAAFELEHLPTFAVDVERRWPSVEKARRMLGWEARIGVRDGIAQTVDWLRERLAA